MEFTEVTRPRNSSGVSSCTSDCRTTTLMLSNAPVRTFFAIVFLWQIPHFMAIAWMYRDDYRSAGFPMLPVVEPDGLRTGQQALLYSAALLPVSIGPTVVGLAGWAYFWLALVLGVILLILSARFARERSERSARTLFFASIIYLPLIWAVMVLDH